MKKERLYDAFGEIIYVLAMADGAVQGEEINALKKVLEDHPWAKEIKWSFKYELDKNTDPDIAFKKAMQTFVDHGPDAEYAQLLDVLEKIAAAYGDVDPKEAAVILDFQYQFKARLKTELQDRELMSEEDMERISSLKENPVSGVSRAHLYDAFGEIIYVVAMADGLIQEEEQKTLKTILAGYEWAKNIIWSFDYESKKGNDLDKLYKKALDTLIANGPDPEYDFLIKILEEMARASAGMESKEANIIIDFEADLRKRFMEDIEKYKLSV